MKYFLPQINLSVDTGFYYMSRISFSSEGTEVTVVVCTFYLLISRVQMAENSFSKWKACKIPIITAVKRDSTAIKQHKANLLE